MNWLLTFIKGSLHTVAYTAVVVSVVVYFALHLSVVERWVKWAITSEVAEQAGTQIHIGGEIRVDWLNQVTLGRVTLYDQQHDTLLYARRIMVAFDLLPLAHHHLVLNTCQLIDFDIRTSRASADSATNYQFLIEAFTRNQDPDKPSFIQHLDLGTILFRQGRLRYDVKDREYAPAGLPSPNHIDINHLSANAHVHNRAIEVKKFHCSLGDIALKAVRFHVDMMPKNSPQGGISFLTLKGLEATSDVFTFLSNASYAEGHLDFDLSRLSLLKSLPDLPHITRAGASLHLTADHVAGPADSILFATDIRHLTLETDTFGLVHLFGTAEGSPTQGHSTFQLATSFGEARGALEYTVNRPFYHRAQHTRPDFSVTVNSDLYNIVLDKLLPPTTDLGTVTGQVSLTASQTPEAEQPTYSASGTLQQLFWKGHRYTDIVFNGQRTPYTWEGDIAVRDTLCQLGASFAVSRTEPHYAINGRVERLNPQAMGITHSYLLDSLLLAFDFESDLVWHSLHPTRTEGTLTLSHLVLAKGDDTLPLNNVQFMGSAEGGFIISPLLSFQYENDDEGECVVKGRVPDVSDVLSFLRLPFTLHQASPFSLTLGADNLPKAANLTLAPLDFGQGRKAQLNLQANLNDAGDIDTKLSLQASADQWKLLGNLVGVCAHDLTKFSLSPSDLLLNDEVIRFNRATLLFGKERPTQLSDLSLQLQGVSLDKFLYTLPKAYTHFGGRLYGTLTLDPDEQTLRMKDLSVRDFSYIGTCLGDATMQLSASLARRRAALTCLVQSDSVHHTAIDFSMGWNKNDSLDLRVKADHLPLDFIDNWTGSILQQFHGTATGNVRLYGPTKAMQLQGDPYVDGVFTHALLGAHFHLHDNLHLSPDLIAFRNTQLDDTEGHSLSVDGEVTHQHLTHFGYDLRFLLPRRFTRNGFLVLDRKNEPGRLFWGKIYAQGNAHLKGDSGKHRFNLQVATADHSWLYLSPHEQDLQSEGQTYSFLTFRDKDKAATERQEQSPQETESPTDIIVDLQVEATEKCKVTVQMDPLSDDKLVCSGLGNFSLRYDPRRDLTLTGMYNIREGSYTMNVRGNLMNKVFQLRNTSLVHFSGRPSEAELSLDASYYIPSVNLSDIDPTLVSQGVLRRSSVPVECLLNVTGPLSAPVVHFDLALKNVSNEVQAQVRSAIGTQEMLNHQVLYLLLFSKFYAPQYTQQSQGTTTSELTSLASASLTSQLNQFLGQISPHVTLGTNVHTERGDFSDVEMDLSLSTRLFSDRLIFSGQIGYRDPASQTTLTTNNTPFIGDFDLEYLINRSGTFRIKAYNHYNERYFSVNNALYTQGIGLAVRREFNSFRHFWPHARKQTHPADTLVTPPSLP